MSTFGISLGFPRLSQSSGQVTHVLLTRSRLCLGPKPDSSLHLHVLSTPPAFVLSQDQTLREELLNVELSMHHTRGCSYTWSKARMRRRGTAVLLEFWLPLNPEGIGGRSNLGDHMVACTAEFSKTVRPQGWGYRCA